MKSFNDLATTGKLFVWFGLLAVLLGVVGFTGLSAAGEAHTSVDVAYNRRVRVLGARLKEGMVVATDVKSETGVLLVRAGTRLTETTAEKLARLFPKGEIELADAAD